MNISFLIREAVRDDMTSISAILPKLANFDLPAGRNPEHLWRGDEALIARWMDGDVPESHVHVAVDDDNDILGLSVISLRPELLSGEPSAHLEVIVVAERARGCGVGHALLQHSESAAVHMGARSMTLHVFANNARARDFYDRCGYEGELLRYIKPLADG